MSLPPLPPDVLPTGVRSRFVDAVNGLRVHLLEAGHEDPGRPCVLLLHGFPELAYSWRHVMPALAAAGYHVVAPDQRGYGRTSGWSADYDGELAPFGMLNLARDTLGLVAALGRRELAAVVGHDFGSPVAAWCALLRPDVFRSVVLMSAPFAGPPTLPEASAAQGLPAADPGAIHTALAALPRPRKHYQWYYGTREANDDMWRCPQGVAGFLRAYYHHKSADWADNRPEPLAGWTADELARLPTYYVMEHAQGMADTVAAEMPSAEAVVACRWLTDSELQVYAGEYERTGFQGGLQWYRAAAAAPLVAGLQLFAGRRIEVPALYIAGRADWGVYQKPGDFEAMPVRGCADLRGRHLIDGAGHWVQQEQAQAVNTLLLDFLRGTG